MCTPGLVALKRNTTSWPGATKVSSPPPSAPVDAWKSILCTNLFFDKFFKVSST